MEWLSKIPPMISALAFGYGVGMATPDSTIDGVRAAVDGFHARPSGPAHQAAPRVAPHVHAGYGPTGPPPFGFGPYPPYAYGYPAAAHHPGGLGSAGVPQRLGGEESSRLARLRGEAAGHTCKLHHPDHSPAPRNLSAGGDDDAEAEIDDIDPAGKAALSRLQLPDFKVSISRKALTYVRFLTRSHRGRDLFESWLKRSGRYQEMVQQALRERQLPEDLIWVAMIESGFDPVAKSPAGAVGLWQFMRSTGKVYGLEVTRYEDVRKDPVRATKAAAHHLRDLYARFGSWDLAMAAYNMGYEQLLDAIDRYNTTDFNELARQKAIPSETANYVPKIVAAALVANNLERYGFADVKVYRPYHVSELDVPGGTPIDTVAKAAGVSGSRLRKYNPHLLTKLVPPGSTQTVYVPATALSRARASLPAMLDKRMVMDDESILAPTNLAGLGGAGGKQARHDAWSEDENLLRFLPKPKRRSLRKLGAVDTETADPLAGVADEFGPRRSDRETVMYRVGPGDTLIGIAKQFAIDIDDLARDNGIDPEDKLREGALLKLYVKRDVLSRWKKQGTGAAAKRDKKPAGGKG